MKELDKMTTAWNEFCAKIEPLLPKPAVEPEPVKPDKRLTWGGIEDGAGNSLRVFPATLPGYAFIEAHDGIDGEIVHVRANAAQLWESALAHASAAMALEGMEEPEDKMRGICAPRHYKEFAWKNLMSVCRKQEGGE